MNEYFKAFLRELELVPPSNRWKKIIVNHTLEPDKKQLDQFKRTNGIYVYQNMKGDILYVGKGKPIYNRVLSHWKEAHAPEFREKAMDWYLFFGERRERLNLYTLEIEDELDRQIIEKMLIKVLNPTFETYRESQKLKREKESKKLSTKTIFRDEAESLKF